MSTPRRPDPRSNAAPITAIRERSLVLLIDPQAYPAGIACERNPG